MPKTKLTGFSRLMLFLLIFLPLAYFGASYYNGEDPIAKIKGFFGQTEASDDYNNHRPGVEVFTPAQQGSAAGANENVDKLQKELAFLRNQLAVSEEKLARCQATNVE